MQQPCTPAQLHVESPVVSAENVSKRVHWLGDFGLGCVMRRAQLQRAGSTAAIANN